MESNEPRDSGALYAHRFSPEEREKKEKMWALLAGWFARYVPDGATVIDLGAGNCELINHTKAARRIAVDLSPSLREDAAEGVEALRIPLAEIGSHIEPGSADVVFASNVFEHLRGAEELVSVLRQVHQILRAGGRLVIMQPNVRHVGGRFWDFLDHTLPLTEKGMEEALGLAGLRVIESRSRFLPYTTKSRLPQHPLLVRMYLFFRPLHWLLGEQMLVVASRPE